MDKLLSNLINAFAVSGHEEGVKALIVEELKDLQCDVMEDKMGNLIVKVGEGSEKLMLCAHMDSIGVIASFIEDNGFIRCGELGEFKNENVIHSFVRFKNGVVGKLSSNKDELFVDAGFKSREEVLTKVKEGDTACFIAPCLEVGDGNIIGPNLDNRVGCYVLLRLIKEVKAFNKEVYFVFSTQQELGGRGARAAAYNINPDYCIIVDLETAGDVIGGSSNIKLGAGPVLKVMDRSLIMHHEIKNMLNKASEELNVPVQYSICDGRSEGGNIHKERTGIKTGELAVPCRYNHSVSEMVSVKDIESTISILKNVIEN